jgi:hypothetical protein
MSLEERYLGETPPTNVDNTSKFLGETTPTNVDNTSRFLGETNPTKMDSSEKFLGETTQTPSNRESKFLGETTPTPSDSSEKFLGETTPIPMNNLEKFLGETNPTKMDSSEKFLGETTPTPSDSSEKFLGETTTKPMSLEERYLGETTPNPANNEPRFLGETTPNEASNESQFLGETTPTPSNNTSRFLGETTPTPSNNTSRFLGETTPNKFTSNPRHSDNGKSFKEVNYFQDIHASGFNSKFAGAESTKFVGVNSNNTKFDNTNSLHSNIDKSKFSTGKNYLKSYEDAGGSNSGEEGFGIGKGHAKRNSPSFLDNQYDKFNLRDDAHQTGMAVFKHPLILRGIQRRGKRGNEPQNFGIPGTSIDFDDGLIRGGIITSTTRAVIDAIRLGKWMVSIKGLLWGVKQFGLQQSNPNVEKIGAIRRTKMWTPINTLASAIGAQIGLHPNRHGFTPFDKSTGGYESVQNLKKAAGQSDLLLGLGLMSPLPSLRNRLVALYNESFKIGTNGSNASQPSKNPTGGWLFNSVSLGGPNSVYGLIPNGKFPYRNEDTRASGILFKNSSERYAPFTVKNQYAQHDSITAPLSTKNNDIGGKKSTLGLGTPDENFRDKTPLAKEYKDKNNDYTEFKPLRTPTSDPNEDTTDTTGNNTAGAIYSNEYTYEENREDLEGNDLAITRDVLVDDTNTIKVNLNTTETHTSYGNPFNNGLSALDASGNNDSSTPGAEVIKDYETIAYGNLPERMAGDVGFHDFRSLSTKDSSEYKRAENANYSEHNINKRVGFGDAGRVANGEDRVRWWNTSPEGDGFLNRFDKVNAAEVGAAEVNDLVHLWFRADGGQRVQFRGIVSGITDTFSPSWNPVKYNGRADQAYNYSTFERSLSFNFKVMATSRVEMKPIWNKLSYLSTMTMPKYGGDSGYQGTLVYFRLGSLYNNKLAFIDQLSYSISDEVAWEISPKGTDNPLGEIPKMVDVQIGLKILGNSRPAVGESSGVYEADFLTKSEELTLEETMGKDDTDDDTLAGGDAQFA